MLYIIAYHITYTIVYNSLLYYSITYNVYKQHGFQDGSRQISLERFRGLRTPDFRLATISLLRLSLLRLRFVDSTNMGNNTQNNGVLTHNIWENTFKKTPPGQAQKRHAREGRRGRIKG